MTLRCTERDGAVTFPVRVVPHSSKTRVEGLHEDSLRIRLAAPPVDGAANDELVRFLARACGVRRNSVEIVGGHTSRAKLVRASGVSRADVERLVVERD